MNELSPFERAYIEAKSVTLRFTIPGEYADYLSLFRDGRIENTSFSIYMEGQIRQTFDVDFFPGIDPVADDAFVDSQRWYISYLHMLPDGLLPFALDGYGNILAIGILKDNYGRVYRAFTDKIEKNTPRLLCYSFNEFLDHLSDKYED